MMRFDGCAANVQLSVGKSGLIHIFPTHLLHGFHTFPTELSVLNHTFPTEHLGHLHDFPTECL